MYPSCVCCVPGLPLCICYFSVGGVLIFSVWFCIVSLSPVSRQWFYPMVGDIMLFYHRVEPRTGCWEVSASVRQSIPPSHKPQGGGQGPWERLVLVVVLLVGPSFSLTCILPQSVCVFFILTCCIYPSLCMFCLHVIYMSNLDFRMCANVLMYCMF